MRFAAAAVSAGVFFVTLAPGASRDVMAGTGTAVSGVCRVIPEQQSLRVGQTITLPIRADMLGGVSAAAKATPSPSPTPTMASPLQAAPGFTIVSVGKGTVLRDPNGFLWTISPPTPVPPTVAAQQAKAAAAKQAAADAAATAAADAATKQAAADAEAAKAAKPYLGLGAPLNGFTVTPPNNKVLSATIATPVPAASASTGAIQNPNTVVATASVTGNEPGITLLNVYYGTASPPNPCIAFWVRVAPEPRKTFILSTGFGASSVTQNSITLTAVTPAPSGMPAPVTSPGIYVTKTEASTGQTFIPVLASYRLTDSPYRYSLYATAGFAANGDPSRLLFGLSYGDENFLVTAGWHTAETTNLIPGLKFGYNAPGTFAPGQPFTYTGRTTRIFAGIVFPITALTCLLSGTGLTAACTKPAPSPGPTASAAAE